MAITQGTNGGQATAASEAAAFEAERNRLITNIQITIITIGQEFEQLSQLWKHFHASAFQRAEEERFDRELLAQEEEDDQLRSQEQEEYGGEEPQSQEREQREEQEDV
ncbi:hypothetical protein KI688_007515 [Linnemannia hyalina]|uniref:DASH complex subunit DAD1 n=1 Tax=Linnemannia hyalina TaxID=64524 RepID=A0A9P7XIE3_9FUNG|nr:hypothetical protein KI688_007515 [Linnemannia hyalina]